MKRGDQRGHSEYRESSRTKVQWKQQLVSAVINALAETTMPPTTPAQHTPGSGKYEKILSRCADLAPVPTAVVHPCEASALAGAAEAARLGLIVPLLIGPVPSIKAIAAAA